MSGLGASRPSLLLAAGFAVWLTTAIGTSAAGRPVTPDPGVAVEPIRPHDDLLLTAGAVEFRYGQVEPGLHLPPVRPLKASGRFRSRGLPEGAYSDSPGLQRVPVREGERRRLELWAVLRPRAPLVRDGDTE